MTDKEIIEKIVELMPSAVVKAYDYTGGGDHWQLTVVADEFRGLSMVEQHQLVYKALGDWMKGPIHALALNTKASE